MENKEGKFMTWINALPEWLGSIILIILGIIVSIAILYLLAFSVDRIFPDSGDYGDDRPARCQDLMGSYDC